MKTVIIGGVVIFLFLLALMARRHVRASADMNDQKDSHAKGKDAYQGLRNIIFSGSRSKFSLPQTSRPTEPWGVVMDWGVGGGTTTVVALSDGTASVYLSSGGGFIGGQGQEPIRNAAKKAVGAAGEMQPRMKETKSFPLPEEAQVQFYALTDAGVYTAGASQEDLQTGHSQFTKLGDAMQEVITQYLIWDEKSQGHQQ